jgi:hypothetical protein
MALRGCAWVAPFAKAQAEYKWPATRRYAVSVIQHPRDDARANSRAPAGKTEPSG